MSFRADMAKHLAKVRAREAALYEACIQHAFRSITVGSPITGAPGQPVDTSALLNSWRLERHAGRTALMFSPLVYAPIIEDNRRGATLRSKVGGFHSVKLTRLAWKRIVKYELQALGGGIANLNARLGQRRTARGRFSETSSASLRVR
jgi:hypothetical protein